MLRATAACTFSTRALFRHLNFPQWSEPAALWPCSLRNVLRATAACIFRNLTSQKRSEYEVFLNCLGNALCTTAACTFSTPQLPKVVRTCGPLTMFASKCASRHSRMHFLTCFWPLSWKWASHHSRDHVFNISTSKSGPRMVCFYHFDFEIRFVPQPRTLFRHLNFQKWFEPEICLACCFPNLLRATVLCKFMRFSSALLTRWLCTRRFNKPTCRPPGATKHVKNTMFRDFTTFSRTLVFFLLIFFRLTLSLLTLSLL